MNQKVVDAIARTFYVALGIAGCLSSVFFVLLGIYGAVSENKFTNRVFFAVMAVVGVATVYKSARWARYVWTHDYLPTDDLGVVEIVIVVEKVFDTQIPDDEAEKMSTPRELIDWLLLRVEGRALSSSAARILSKQGVADCLGCISAADTLWTREKISVVVMSIVAEQTGYSGFTEDSKFIGDMFV